MRKTFIVLALPVLCIWMSMTVLAGNINDAEQKIVDLMGTTFLINDAYYRIKEEYAQKVNAYLIRDDVDMSEKEVNDYIDQFYANLGYGISKGYLVKVEEKKEPGGSKTGDVPSDNEKQTGETSDESSVQKEIVVNGELDTDLKLTPETEDKIKSIKEELEVSQGKEKKAKEKGTASEEIPESIKEYDATTEPSDSVKDTEVGGEEKQSGGDKTEGKAPVGKDYSHAAPLTQNINVGVIALFVAFVILGICVWIVIRHKAKERKY